MILALISLSVLFAGRAGAADSIVLNPTSFDFGAKHVGGEASEPGEFTVTNTGDTAVHLGLATTIPIQSLPFRISPVGDYCSFETLDPDESCPIIVTFDPDDPGDFTGSLLINSDAPGDPSAAALTGLAYPRLLPDVKLTPDRVDFGKVGTGIASDPRTIEVKNTGEGDMALGVSEISGEHANEFRIAEDRCDGIVMASGSVCRIDVIFTPGTAGIRNASLRVPTDVEGADTTVPLTGTGVGIVPDPDPDPDPVPSGTAKVRIAAKLPALRGRRLSLPVTCVVNRLDRCAGSVAARAGGVTAGRSGFSIRPGKARITLKLKPRTVRRLARSGALKATFTLRVKQGEGDLGTWEFRRTIRRSA